LNYEVKKWDLTMKVQEGMMVQEGALTTKEVLVQEKCIKQNALAVVMIAKYLSNQQKASQFIAKNVIRRIKDFNSKISTNS
jgi:hypothetical protein